MAGGRYEDDDLMPVTIMLHIRMPGDCWLMTDDGNMMLNLSPNLMKYDSLIYETRTNYD